MADEANDGSVAVLAIRCANCGMRAFETPGDPVPSFSLRERHDIFNGDGEMMDKAHPPFQRPKPFEVRREGRFICTLYLAIKPDTKEDEKQIAAFHGGDELVRIGNRGPTGQWRNVR